MKDTVQEYFDSVPPARRGQIIELHNLIIDLYPHAWVDMHFKMPTYHSGDAWVALANQKNYISIYTCDAHHLAEFKEKHPGIKTGKGCINFQIGAKIPLTDLKQVIKYAMGR